jgi:hypothetical protein
MTVTSGQFQTHMDWLLPNELTRPDTTAHTANKTGYLTNLAFES